MSDIKLRPCPWCGVVPETTSGVVGTVVYCANPECPVEPEGRAASDEEARTAWNTRVDHRTAPLWA